MNILDAINRIWGYVTKPSQEIADGYREQCKLNKNIENYCILDTHKGVTDKTIDIQLNIKNKSTEINFKNVNICNNIKTMIKCAGKLWNLPFSTLVQQNNTLLDESNSFTPTYTDQIINYVERNIIRRHPTIVVSINDKPFHMGHIYVFLLLILKNYI